MPKTADRPHRGAKDKKRRQAKRRQAQHREAQHREAQSGPQREALRESALQVALQEKQAQEASGAEGSGPSEGLLAADLSSPAPTSREGKTMSQQRPSAFRLTDWFARVLRPTLPLKSFDWTVPAGIAESRTAFKKQRQALAKKYPGMWVAFLGGQFAGVGDDSLKLRTEIDPNGTKIRSLYIEHVFCED